MRIARYRVGSSGDGEVGFGVVEGAGDDLAVARIPGHPFAPFALSGERHRASDVRLLAPVLPSKVVCVGKNYAAHAQEMGGEPPARPVLFLKPSTSVIGPGDTVLLPADSDRVDHEAELAVVIGRLCRDVPVDRVAEVVLGYTCANDVTARDHQQADGQWTRGKGHDTFCPLGPWIETTVDPAAGLRVRCEVDGELRQDGTTRDLVHDVAAVVSYVSHVMTLLPGDVLLTGTPAGVGPLVPGSVVSVTIDGIGTLRNPVAAR